ncbi:hypothetical protein [Zobellella sp. An-6]|uniref:hypothetical protein n=1 Tax=Zobellella sp. An-6 TaxID=3400218 RepID=UPI004040EB85
MELLEQWKSWITQANRAFAHDRFELACGCYQQALTLLAAHWPPDGREEPVAGELDSESLIVCLSISVRSLAETYARQGRRRRCLGLLRRTLRQLSAWQQRQPLPMAVDAALLRECGRLWRELCRLEQAQAALGRYPADRHPVDRHPVDRHPVRLH